MEENIKQNTEIFDAEVVKKRDPTIMIINVDNEINIEQLTEIVTHQNTELFEDLDTPTNLKIDSYHDR